MPAPGLHERRAVVRGISALVTPWSGVQRLREPGSDPDQRDHRASAEGTDDRDKLHVSVRLTALLRDGPTVTSDHDDFGISAPRHGLVAIWRRYHGPRLSDDPATESELLNRAYRVGLPDIEDAINQLLGRDPEQHRPPRLAWGPLIEALAAAGVVVTEQELIDAPLTIELSPEVEAQFADTPH